ncbi:MAG TPA: hypothetical protein VIJ38_01540 [Acidobacteriaceae bacterium]
MGTSVQFVASANTTTCSKGVAAMGIYVDNSLDYVVNGISLNTTLSLATGSHLAVVEEWDYCGGATSARLTLTVSTQSGVSVASPANGSTVSSPAAYVATATTACAKGVAATGIYVDNQLTYVGHGASLNTQLALPGGSHKTVVQDWDNCGGSATATVNVNVAGTTFSNLQALGGWNQWGELAPTYNICTSSCPGITWSMIQHVNSPSLSGNATQFNIGGTTPYSDVLWSNPLIGDGTTEGLPDKAHTLLPSIHNMTVDTEVYVTNFAITQDLEFDINMYMNGVGMEWGTECNHLADGVWDIWNNVNATWVPTTIPCNLNNAAWNHVTLQMQRESNNDLLYQSITVNGVTHTINQTVAPFPVPSGWWGMTVNYQMDGNHNQAANATYLDNTSVTYW